MCKPRTSAATIWKFVGEAQLRWYIQPNKTSYGSWMRRELTNLGPAFIKLGQFLSTRSDILGKEIVQELARLQDDIHPLPYEEIKHLVDDALQKPWSTVFRTIDNTPLACASIGQVHRGTLLDGRQVVLKIQKPCVARQIKEDVATLRDMNTWLAKTGSPRSVEIENILSQYERFLSCELDYQKEIKHMHHFADVLDGLPVKVPSVYSEYSSDLVIVMEYIPSTKITDVTTLRLKGLDTERIADALVQTFLYQIVYAGIVHCDPHPGNIGVADDESLVLYDFGNVVELSSSFRKELNNLVYSIFSKDVDEFFDLLVKLEVLDIRDDMEAMDIKAFFQYFFDYLETLDFESLKSSIVQQDFRGGVQVNIRVNPDFLSLFRVFSLLDGTCIALNPNFNYIEALRPYTEDMMRDIRFIDTRVRKDVLKMRSYPTYIQNTNGNILRMQKKMRLMGQSFQQFQMLMVFWLWIDHKDDWVPWVASVFMLAWMSLQGPAEK